MLNYEEMSDLQINLLVAKAAGVDAVENSGVVFGEVKHEEQVRGAVKSVHGWSK